MSCLNEFNTYFYNQFEKLAKSNRHKNNKHLAIVYRTVSNSIQKYPFPILNLSHAQSLEGVGSNISKIFEKLLDSYKQKIREESIDFKSLAVKINLNLLNKTKAKQTKQRNADQITLLKKRRKVNNIPAYSPLWCVIISAYVNFVDSNDMTMTFDDLTIMGSTLSIQFQEFLPMKSFNENDVLQVEQTNFYEKIDKKKRIVQFSYDMINFVKAELEKSGINVSPSNGKGGVDISLDENWKSAVNNNKSLEKDPRDSLRSITSKQNTVTLRTSKRESSLDKENNKIISFLDCESPKISYRQSIVQTKAMNSCIIRNFLKFASGDFQYERHQEGNSTENDFSLLQKRAKARSYSISLIVDNRELTSGGEQNTAFVSLMERLGSEQCRSNNLSLGDFLWVYKDNESSLEYVLDVIIERKTLDDLASSIIDGRYSEQKHRLKASSIKNVYYIIEGNLQGYNVNQNLRISKQAISIASMNISIIHDYNVIRTNNMKDTAKTIEQLDKLVRSLYSKGIKPELYEQFSDFQAKNQKSRKLSLETIFYKQLRSVSDLMNLVRRLRSEIHRHFEEVLPYSNLDIQIHEGFR